MFNQGDYRMAKAQQERLLAEAEKQGGRARRPNFFGALIRWLKGTDEEKTTAKLKPEPAKAEL